MAKDREKVPCNNAPACQNLRNAVRNRITSPTGFCGPCSRVATYGGGGRKRPPAPVREEAPVIATGLTGCEICMRLGRWPAHRCPRHEET